MSDPLTASAAAGAIVPVEDNSPDASETCGCGNPLFFHNTQCVACGAPVGFDPSTQRLGSFTVDSNTGSWRKQLPTLAHQAFRPCSQRQNACNCNWMLAADTPDQNCLSCRLTEIIPLLEIPGHAELWGKAELAKRRVLAQLLRLSLPVRSKAETPSGLAFKFLASVPGETILTGHEDGVITLNICEADDSQREAIREKMGEKYRTLAGHIRHELGHYYWDFLSQDAAWLVQFRACFGDERQDYAQALQHHHQQTACAKWSGTFISAYASCHPWEDWAETFGHFLHLEEGLSLAQRFGLEPNHLRLWATHFDPSLLPADVDHTTSAAFVADLNRWIRLSLLVNELAEGLGHPHPSPFILNVATVRKLWQVHQALHLLQGHSQ